MRSDLVEKAEREEREARGLFWPAESAAKRPAEVELLPEVQPKAGQGQSGIAHVAFCGADKPRANPWEVRTAGSRPRGGFEYLARVATPAEGAAVWQAYQSAGDKLRDVSPKAMRQTVKRMARQVVDGQLPLPLRDGLDGEG